MGRAKLTTTLLLTLVVVPQLQAGTITVTNTNDSGPGSLGRAIADALPGDEIQFDPSLDGQPIVLNHWTELRIDKDLTITGRGPDKTIIRRDCCYYSRKRSTIDVRGYPTVLISGVTIQGWREDRFIDGIKNWGAHQLTLRHTTVRGFGGNGIESVNSPVIIEHSRISDNGQGISLDHGSLFVKNSTITKNEGTGIFGNRPRLVVEDSSITHNQGGILLLWNVDPPPRIERSTISNNVTIADTVDGWCLTAGGVFWYTEGAASGPLRIVNTTISNNRAECRGTKPSYPWPFHYAAGGVFATALDIESSTIVDNAAGGALDTADGIAVHLWGAPAKIRNSVLSNSGALHPERACLIPSSVSLGHNLDNDGTCGLDQPTDQPNTNPMLGPLQDNYGPTWTHRPLPGSPLIDRGSCQFLTDQRGVPRPLDGNQDNVAICDIGAVEYAPVKVIGPDGDVIVDPSDPE